MVDRLAGGPWSPSPRIVRADPNPTAEGAARANPLLDRYGVVSRNSARSEEIPGGFTPLYRVLREMEEQGRVRRGHFVDGLEGAQFAYAGAIDRLRSSRDDAEERDRVVTIDDITVLEFFPAVELILNEHGHCAGAVLYNMETQEYVTVKAKSTILATGGTIAGAAATETTAGYQSGQVGVEALLAAVPSGYRIVALDEGGRQWSTRELARQLESWMQEESGVCFLVGGPDGLSDACRERARDVWSLSRLTLPHPMVRTILAEQLYRAWTITQNHPYHREGSR